MVYAKSMCAQPRLNGYDSVAHSVRNQSCCVVHCAAAYPAWWSDDDLMLILPDVLLASFPQ